MNFDPNFWSGKMFPDCFLASPPSTLRRKVRLKVVNGIWTKIATLKPSCVRFETSGFLDATGLWTRDTSAWPSDESAYSECSLAEILQPAVAPKYFLSQLAASGILRRAANRGKTLPPQLDHALQAVASANQDAEEKTTRTLSSKPSKTLVKATGKKAKAPQL